MERESVSDIVDALYDKEDPEIQEILGRIAALAMQPLLETSPDAQTAA